MSFKSYAKAVVLMAGFCAVNANAAFVDVTGTANIAGSTGVLNLTDTKSNPFTITFSDATKVETILYSNDANGDVGNQSPNNVGEIIKQEFNLFSVTEVDKAGNGKIKSNNGPFQYLALHVGKDRELFFKFLLGVEEFNIDISKNGGGLGNWRAYNGAIDPPSAVPVPAAVWLFGSALTGLMGLSKKKRA